MLKEGNGNEISQINSSKIVKDNKELNNEDYFEGVVGKFKDHISHLKKRNDHERKVALNKKMQGEKLEDAQYPFEIIF